MRGHSRKRRNRWRRNWRIPEPGLVNIVGGCCGTTPAHIRAIAKWPRETPARPAQPSHRAYFSGIELVEARTPIAR